MAERDRRRGESGLATVEEAIADYRAGKFVIIVDDEDRENEGDLVMAAEFCTAEHINFMAKYGRGLICMPMTEERIDHLGIPMMVTNADNSSHFGTPFTVSVEARAGVTTGTYAVLSDDAISRARGSISSGTTGSRISSSDSR